MSSRRGRRGRGKAQSGAITEPSSTSSVGTPRPEYVPTIVASTEGSATPRPPSRDKSRSFYRLAFASVDMIVSEGYLTQHPKLPPAVKKLLDPIQCIPSSIKEKVSLLFELSLIFPVQH